MECEKGENPAPMKKLKSQYRKKVEAYVELVEKDNSLSKLNRMKIVALIIIDEHNREIIEDLHKNQVMSPAKFEWRKQLQFYKSDG